jgi:glycosyltransferase involved in cell wall biosynthesis
VTQDGRYGVLVPRGDHHSLALAMERMLRPEVRDEYSALGLQRVAELSPQASAAALTDFLTRQLGVPA